MRLFTALDLSGEVIANLEAVLDRLRPTAAIQWSRPANLHITTKFIGEWPEERLAELESALGTLPPREAIPVRVRQLGFFPTPRSLRVVWCGVEAPALTALAADTARACETLGIESEKRAYTPHLTLARIKGASRLDALRAAVASLSPFEGGSFQARSFFLYRSQLLRGGSVYTKLAEFPLTPS